VVSACRRLPSKQGSAAMNRAILAAAIAAILVAVATIGRGAAEELVERKESLYNNIYVFREGDIVSMTFGFNRKIFTESQFDTKDELDLPVTYTRYMTAGLMYAKNVSRILEIGFGGGRTSWYLHRSLPNVPITSVELDPAVLELAKKYFGIRDEPNFSVVNLDGRSFLKNSSDKYDIILVDAYRGPFVPFHLLTKEFYALIKDHLAEGGVVMQNVEPTTMLFDSAVLTINAVFPQVEFYLANGNVVTVAYDGAQRSVPELQATADARQAQFGFRYRLSDMLAHRRPLNALNGSIDKGAKVLTDDFAPVETLKAIEQHNRKWTEQ
jgi:spermidine synthase